MWLTFIHFFLIINIVLLGEHRPLHQRCDFEEPGGSFSRHLRAGSEPYLHLDGERLLRSLPAVWAVSGTPQVNWLAQLLGDSFFGPFTVLENSFKVFNTVVGTFLKLIQQYHHCLFGESEKHQAQLQYVSLQLTEAAHC